MKKICMLIPGNPAIAGQYLQWIQEIEMEHPDLDIRYATSYVLFDKKLNYVDYEKSMCTHYEKVLLDLSESNGKVTIIAHSVGSYFALRLLEKYPEKIEKIAILFPYIGYSTIWALKFVSIPYWIDRIFPLAETVARFKKFFSKRYDHCVLDITNSELTACLRFGVRQCVYFNKHKFDIGAVSAHKDKLLFAYTEGDRWCPQETIDKLGDVLPTIHTNLPHDFIMTSKNRVKMVSELRDFLI